MTKLPSWVDERIPQSKPTFSFSYLFLFKRSGSSLYQAKFAPYTVHQNNNPQQAVVRYTPEERMTMEYRKSLTFPAEIWLIVFEFLRWNSTSTLKQLSLTCPQFHSLILPLLFYQLSIPLLGTSPSKGKTLLKCLAANDINPGLLRCIRMVEISGIFQQSQSMQLSKLLVRVLEKLERLEVIRWECTLVPSNILLHLNQRQRTPRVYIKTHGTLLSRDYSDRPKFNSPSIWSFSTSLSPANFCQHNAVKNLIFSSPSLQTLRIRIRYGVESGLPVLFILDRNDVLPAIKTMKLTNCRFERNQAERWAQCLQADHLKSLTLDGTDHLTDLLIHLTGRVPNLTSLGLRIRPDRYGNLSRTCAALEKFLRGINALESFTAFDFPRSILSTVVTLQGPHLRTLRFRRTRFNGPGKSVFTFAELRSYALSLPRLERLGIDLCVYQPPCYSYDILLGIGRFPGLKHVELNVPFLRGEYAAYHVNALGAEMVFRHLSWAKMWYKKLRPQEGPWARFETLDIKLGEWEPIRPPLASGSPIRQQMYTCRRVSDSSDKPMTVLVTRGYEPGDDDNRYERALASAGLRDMADGL